VLLQIVADVMGPVELKSHQYFGLALGLIRHFIVPQKM